MTGRKLSCCALLKRWISSTKSSVPRPTARRPRAASNTFFSSATPVKIADTCSKCRSVSCASSRATVVLPVPGGPQKISEPSERLSIMRVRMPSGPVRCSCPTTSARRCGRSRSASGRGAAPSSPALAKRSDKIASARQHGGERPPTALQRDAPHPRRRGGWRFTRSAVREIATPFTSRITSPAFRLVRSAGEPSTMAVTTTPLSASTVRISSTTAGDRLTTVEPAKRRAVVERDLVARNRLRGRLQRNGKRHWLALPDDRHLDRPAEGTGGEAVAEGVGIIDLLSGDGGDEVARAQAALLGRAARTARSAPARRPAGRDQDPRRCRR